MRSLSLLRIPGAARSEEALSSVSKPAFIYPAKLPLIRSGLPEYARFPEGRETAGVLF
jgi:hypothetical protein